jgi:hypothetical protein
MGNNARKKQPLKQAPSPNGVRKILPLKQCRGINSETWMSTNKVGVTAEALQENYGTKFNVG